MTSPTPRARLEDSVQVVMESQEGDLSCTVYTGLGRAYSRAESWIQSQFEDRNIAVFPMLPSISAVEQRLVPNGKHKSMILQEDSRYTLMIRMCRVRDQNGTCPGN